MAISDLQADYTLINEWNSVVTYANQLMSFSDILINNISNLTSDPNFSLNASADESQYIQSLLSYIQNFVAGIPTNPDE
jgi:hypothetical protein